MVGSVMLCYGCVRVDLPHGPGGWPGRRHQEACIIHEAVSRTQVDPKGVMNTARNR